MAGGTSILLREQRRHRLMNMLLIILLALGGAAVTNQRSLFAPISLDGLISATARAFAAVAAPSGFGARRMDHVPMVLPLPPLDVHALPREVRRRLTEALSTIPDDNQTASDDQPLIGDGPMTIAPLTQLALLQPGDGGTGGNGGTTNGPGPGPDGALPPNPGGIDGAVPEPSAWAMMILGFVAVGSALRARSLRRLALD